MFGCEVKKTVFLYRRLEGRSLLDEVWHQFGQSARVHHRARENMRADRRAFLDHRNLDFAERLTPRVFAFNCALVFGDELRQMYRAAQIRRAGADQEHIHFQAFALAHIFTLIIGPCAQ